MAGGICAHEVAVALKKKNYEVHIVCYQRKGEKKYDEYEGLIIHRIKSKWVILLRDLSQSIQNDFFSDYLYKVAMLLNKASKIFFIKWFPLTSPFLAINYYKKAAEIIGQDLSTKILAFYSPVESPLAALILKKKFPTTDFVVYMLDSLGNSDGNKYMSQEWVNKKGVEWERKIFDRAKGIINLRCHEEYYNNLKYDIFRNKMMIADIPLLRETITKNINIPSAFDAVKINWVYAGSLDSSIRNPDFACDFFLALTTKNNKNFHFFSKGNCETTLKKYANKSQGLIIPHGHVPINIIHGVFNQADILVNIGNEHSDFIPSKIFEYISKGKAIVHFYSQNNDICIPYLQRYPLAICIKQDYSSLEKNIERYEEFEKLISDVKIDFNELKEIFIENTPEYNAELINKIFYTKENSDV
jgi:hypothetical protein